MLTITTRRQAVAAPPPQPEEAEPAREHDHESPIRMGSLKLGQVIRQQQGMEWDCGHNRAPENTQVVGGQARCRTCRRHRWRRGFRLVALRRQAYQIATEAARIARVEQRENMMRGVVHGGSGRLPFDLLVSGVAAYFGTTSSVLLSPSRVAEITRARSVVVRVLRERKVSYPTIGRLFSRDHSSVIHSRSMFDVYAKQDARVLEAYDIFRDAQ